MLRKALDAAEKQQQLLPPADSETTSLATGNDEYGSLAKTSEGDDESDVEDSTFAFGDDDDDDDELDLEPRRGSSVYKFFLWIHGLFLVIANVDNLWDSPTHRRTRKTWCVVSFWFTMLATAYALERTTFKLLVDRTGPFRLFSAVVLTATHAILLSLGMVISRLVNKTWGRGFKTLGIPLVDVGRKLASCLDCLCACHELTILHTLVNNSNGAVGFGPPSPSYHFGVSYTANSHCHSGATHHSADLPLFAVHSSRRLLYIVSASELVHECAIDNTESSHPWLRRFECRTPAGQPYYRIGCPYWHGSHHD